MDMSLVSTEHPFLGCIALTAAQPYLCRAAAEAGLSSSTPGPSWLPNPPASKPQFYLFGVQKHQAW